MNGASRTAMNHGMEMLVGNLLRSGVILAGATVFAGSAIYLFYHGLDVVHYKTFQGEPEELCHVAGIVKNAFTMHGRGLIQLGLLFLIATPVARVSLSLIIFVRQRDYLYTAVTLLVLGILIYSLLYR